MRSNHRRQIRNGRFFRWMFRNSRILILGWFAVITLIFGLIGFSRDALANSESYSFLDKLYLTLQLFILQSGAGLKNISWELQVARFAGALFGIFAAVQILASIFYQRWQLLWIRLFYRHHVIICGLGGIGPLLAERFLYQGRQVVIIELKPDNKFIQSAKEQGALVLIGDGADAGLLHKAGIAYADLVMAVCGSDGKNAEIVIQVAKFADKGNPPTELKEFVSWLVGRRRWHTHRTSLRCYAHILNLHLCHYLAGQSVTAHSNKWFQVEFFNIFDSGARMILEEDRLLFRSNDNKTPHIAIVGLNEIGQSLVIRAERTWRANKKKDEKLQLTLVDANADDKLRLLECAHPSIKKNCEITRINEGVQESGFLDTCSGVDGSLGNPISHVYICQEEDSAGMTLGLMLLQYLRGRGVTMTVCLLGHGGLSGILIDRGKVRTPASGFESLKVFDLLEKTCGTWIGEQGLFEDLAIAIHDHYCAKKVKDGVFDDQAPRFFPWFSREDGYVLSDEIKEQNRRQARTIGESLWKIGYGIEPSGDAGFPMIDFSETDEEILKCRRIMDTVQQRKDYEPDKMFNRRIAIESRQDVRKVIDLEGESLVESDLEFLARMEHESWLQSWIDRGWRVGERDDMKKTRPHLYHWYDPRLDDQNARDFTRRTICDWPELLAAVDLQIYDRKVV